MKCSTYIKGALAVAVGLFVSASYADLPYSENFESYALDTPIGTVGGAWSAGEGDQSIVTTNPEVNDTQVLKVATDGTTLTNNFGTANIAEQSVYMDADVLFVPSEELSAFDVEAEGNQDLKLGLYSYKPEGAETANLVIFHSFTDEEGYTWRTNDVTGVEIPTNSAVHVKVVMKHYPGEHGRDAPPTAFSVAINDAPVTSPLAYADEVLADENDYAGAMDPAGTMFLVANLGGDETAERTVSALNISGTGYIDNIDIGNPETVHYVAQIGANKYETLQAAVDALAGGETIDILDDITLEQRVNLRLDVTINLNGHKITGTEEGWHMVFMILGDGTDVVINGASDEYGEGEIVGNISLGGEKTKVQHVRSLTINGGYYHQDVPTEAAFQTHGNDQATQTIVFNNARFESTDVTLYLPAPGNVTLNNCEVDGDTAIYGKSGSITLVDTTVRAHGDYTAVNPYSNGAFKTGSAIVLETNAAYAGEMALHISGDNTVIQSDNGYAIHEYSPNGSQVSTIEISGNGQFSGGADKEAILVSQNYAQPGAISGGRFSSKIPDSLIVDGFTTSDTPVDGFYTIVAAAPAAYAENDNVGDDQGETLTLTAAQADWLNALMEAHGKTKAEMDEALAAGDGDIYGLASEYLLNSDPLVKTDVSFKIDSIVVGTDAQIHVVLVRTENEAALATALNGTIAILSADAVDGDYADDGAALDAGAAEGTWTGTVGAKKFFKAELK